MSRETEDVALREPAQAAQFSDPVAEVIAREHALRDAKNRTEFLVNPRSLMAFYDLDNFREFDLNETVARARLCRHAGKGRAGIHRSGRDLRSEGGGE